MRVVLGIREPHSELLRGEIFLPDIAIGAGESVVVGMARAAA
jgi:hypothetical protein